MGKRKRVTFSIRKKKTGKPAKTSTAGDVENKNIHLQTEQPLQDDESMQDDEAAQEEETNQKNKTTHENETVQKNERNQENKTLQENKTIKKEQLKEGVKKDQLETQQNNDTSQHQPAIIQQQPLRLQQPAQIQQPLPMQQLVTLQRETPPTQHDCAPTIKNSDVEEGEIVVNKDKNTVQESKKNSGENIFPFSIYFAEALRREKNVVVTILDRTAGGCFYVYADAEILKFDFCYLRDVYCTAPMRVTNRRWEYTCIPKSETYLRWKYINSTAEYRMYCSIERHASFIMYLYNCIFIDKL